MPIFLFCSTVMKFLILGKYVFVKLQSLDLKIITFASVEL